MKDRTGGKYCDQGSEAKDKNEYSERIAVPRLEIHEFLNARTGILNKEASLFSVAHAMILDNTYSAINAKNLLVHIVRHGMQ